MSDLICSRCGVTTTYADAQILDAEKTCAIHAFDNKGNAVELPATHNWSE